MPRSGGSQDEAAVMEIKAGEAEALRLVSEPASMQSGSDGITMSSSGCITMSSGETVSFSITAPEGTRIGKIEISRKE